MKDGNIALMHVSNQGYHKLPGGGINEGESIEDGLRREMLEETGCEISIISEIGKIIEYRTHMGEVQTSYCFLADTVSVGEQNLDDEEKEAGHDLHWVPIDDALRTLKSDKPNAKEEIRNYMGKFIIKRDTEFIKAAKRILEK